MCASVHTGLRAWMCARAGVRECRCARMRGWVHAHMREECGCVVSGPASSPPWKPSVGLACMPCSYSNSGAPGAAASEHLAVEPLAAVDHHGFTSMRDTAIPQKQFLNSPVAGLWIFVVSKASGRSLFDHSFRPYLYVYIQKNFIYTYYTAYIYTG